MRVPSFFFTGLALACLACGSRQGDKPADAGPPDPLGGGLRIRQITPPKAGNAADGIPPNPDHPGQNQSVTVTGAAVVTVDTFDETQDGKSIGDIYVQDVASVAPFSGIELFSATFIPASQHVAPGDVVDLTGPYQDYTGPTSFPFPTAQVLPELAKPSGTFRFEYTAPVPAVIDAEDLNVVDAAHFEKGARWLGMLVTVENVTLTTTLSNSKGRVSGSITSDTANGAAIDNELYDLQATDFPMGQAFKSITGVVTYFYDFHVSPRSPADLVTK